MLQRKYVGRWLGLLCVLFGLGWSARAHAVELQLHWKKGQAFKIYWNTEQVIDQVAMGQKTQIQQTIGTGYIFRTIDVKAGGIAKVEVLFKRIYFKVQTIQGVFEYNSAKPPEKIPPLAQGFAALLGRRFVMEITSHGKVVGLEGVDKMLEDVMRSLQAGSPQQRAQLQMQLKQQFGNVALRQMMEQMMAIYPERSIKVGESWGKTLRMGGAVPMVLKRRWKLVALRGGFAFLRVNAQILPNKLGKPLRMGPLSLRYNLAGNQTGTLFVQLESGFPLRGKSKQFLKGTIKVSSKTAKLPPNMNWPVKINTTVDFRPF
ncbi:MAG: hypothetical protein H6727_06900 [Myxococcales bacterium]|nr:hypothetical protein [Myxococcales bacterium]